MNEQHARQRKNWLREVKKTHSLSDEDVAAVAHVSVSTASAWSAPYEWKRSRNIPDSAVMLIALRYPNPRPAWVSSREIRDARTSTTRRRRTA